MDKTGKGEEKTSWVVDYVDTKGKRRLKTFAKKKDADQFAATAKVEVREGVHVADRETVTVIEAGELWISSSEAAGLERVTVETYRARFSLHVAPVIGTEKLSKITVPVARSFAREYLWAARTPSLGCEPRAISLSSQISTQLRRFRASLSDFQFVVCRAHPHLIMIGGATSLPELLMLAAPRPCCRETPPRQRVRRRQRRSAC